MPLTALQRRQRRAAGRKKTFICARCGDPFEAVRRDAKFCSDVCRQPLSPDMADKFVRRYLRRHWPLPRTLDDLLTAIGGLNELLRATGLTVADMTTLLKEFGQYYFDRRLAQAQPKVLPPGAAPACYFPPGQEVERRRNWKHSIEVRDYERSNMVGTNSGRTGDDHRLPAPRDAESHHRAA
jgi:hypothetical protein